MPAPAILCLNSGSSSLKFALYRLDEGDRPVEAGAVDGIGRGGARDHATAARTVIDTLADRGRTSWAAVGHRVVHGGPAHAAPARVDASLLAELRRLVPLAPLHLPAEIACIETVATRLPGVPQVACFDTAFHRRMPEVAQRFPLPDALWDAGVRRYGFHGLSYEYVVGHLGGRAMMGRAVIAHLGSGASLAAVRDGEPVDTTMGLTPAGGVMMGTRTGDLDPGVLLYLLRQNGGDVGAVERLVNQEAGLLGVSGLTADMQTLLERRDSLPAAARAVELFCRQVRKHAAALAAVLGGLDTLVFTGGIGEHAAPVRAEICAGLSHLGVAVDPSPNARHAEVVSAPGSTCTVRVVSTDENLVVARHTQALLAARG